MATPIKNIPILTGEAAKRFNEMAERNFANRKELAKREEKIRSIKSILKKANF